MASRNVEAVFVLDGTGTMHTKIDSIKEKALGFAECLRSFYKDLAKSLPNSYFQPITPKATSFSFDFADIFDRLPK